MKWYLRQILLDVIHFWMVGTARGMRTSISNERSRALHSIGKRASSIWLMDKEQLISQGLLELGMTKERLEKMRVGEIRQTIKDHRDNISKATTGTPSNHELLLPKGLGKMNRAQLQRLCQDRGIDTTKPDQRGGHMNIEQMIQAVTGLITHNNSVKTQLKEEEDEWQDMMGEHMDISAAPSAECDAVLPEPFTPCLSTISPRTKQQLEAIWANPQLSQAVIHNDAVVMSLLAPQVVHLLRTQDPVILSLHLTPH